MGIEINLMEFQINLITQGVRTCRVAQRPQAQACYCKTCTLCLGGLLAIAGVS